MRRALALLTAALALLAAPAAGQGGEFLPAEVRLGRRVETLRRTWAVAPLVVIADDGGAYLRAIGEWTPERRFPVLIDDGSDAAREHIARFVRAFGPERVRLLSRSDGDPSPTREGIESAVARAWGATGAEALRGVWEASGFAPPGVVVADAGDRAWPAAAALAAGRGQPVVWAASPSGRLGGRIEPDDLQRLEDAVEAALRGWPWGWEELGDDIESLTVCLNAPTKVVDAQDQKLALTDHLARRADGARWGWAGQVFGDESESSYRAMCALFLQPERAWLFNGYSGGGAFAAYGMGEAAQALEQAGVGLLASGRPAGGRADWATASAGGVDAGLVLVNSSGQRRWFDLAPGRASGVDTPMLRRPAAAHVIHSFSAQNLDDRASIARAWLDQGAFLYAGSVDEPYLRAFVTPRVLTQRLLAPAPFAASARKSGPVWKINILGDPLYTVGPAAPAFEGGVDFAGLRAARTDLQAALRRRDFHTAGRLLVMLGRDADAVALAEAGGREEGESVGPGLARAALLAAVREGELDLAARLHDRLPQALRDEPIFVNPFWHLFEASAGVTGSEAAVGLAGRLVRESRYERDAEVAARATARLLGDAVAAALLTRLMDTAPREGLKRKLAELLERY